MMHGNPPIIRDESSGASFSICIVDSDYITVEIENPSLSAKKIVYIYRDFLSLIEFFEDLSAHWKGWVGVRTFSSLEGDFSIHVTHDSRASVSFQVSLKEEISIINEWSVEVKINIALGELESIPKKLRALHKVDL